MGDDLESKSPEEDKTIEELRKNLDLVRNLGIFALSGGGFRASDSNIDIETDSEKGPTLAELANMRTRKVIFEVMVRVLKSEFTTWTLNIAEEYGKITRTLFVPPYDEFLADQIRSLSSLRNAVFSEYEDLIPLASIFLSHKIDTIKTVYYELKIVFDIKCLDNNEITEKIFRSLEDDSKYNIGIGNLLTSREIGCFRFVPYNNLDEEFPKAFRDSIVPADLVTISSIEVGKKDGFKYFTVTRDKELFMQSIAERYADDTVYQQSMEEFLKKPGILEEQLKLHYVVLGKVSIDGKDYSMVTYVPNFKVPEKKPTQAAQRQRVFGDLFGQKRASD